MLEGVLFRLNQIPDLSLTKYASFDGGEIEGVLEKHNSFLRQFSRKPGISIHLLYAYNPASHDGSKLHIYYLVVGTNPQTSSQSLSNVRDIVEASPLSTFFRDLKVLDFSESNRSNKRFPEAEEESGPCICSLVDIEAFLSLSSETGVKNNAPDGFRCCSTLVKAARFIQPSAAKGGPQDGYYMPLEYKENETSRLYSMMKLMESFDSPVLYRVDLYPASSDTLRSELPINDIRKSRDQMSRIRDYELEGIERSFEKLLEKLDGSPIFNANISVFSNDIETSRAILEAAASEAIEKGTSDIAHFRKGSGEPGFGLLAFIRDEWKVSLESCTDRGRFRITQATRRVSQTESESQAGLFVIDSRAWCPPYSYYSYVTTQFTLEEASSFFRFPVLEDGEFIQRKKETAPELFPAAKDGKSAVYLGRDANGQRVYFEKKKLSKHAFISGVPGSGKTVTMCHLASSLVDMEIPFLVLEPAKTEYRALLNNPEMAPKIALFSPGGNTPFPLRINPFEMPIGVSVGHHINRLCQVFEGSFPLEGALPFLLDRAIEAIYVKTGWDSKDIRTGAEDRPFPTLSMLYDQVQEELEKENYDGEIAGNLKSAIHMRIGGLLRRELGDIFDVPVSTIEPGDWIKKTAIIELEALGAGQSNFITLLLCVLVRESLMVAGASKQLRHVLFIEEAHNLIGPEAADVTGENADPKIAATAFISNMLREVRALGEGIIIADQLPTAIAPEVLKNTGLKVALRMTSEDDRALLGSMMSANAAQLEKMAVANPGQALVMYEGLQRPFEVSMSNWLHDPAVKGYISDSALREERLQPKNNGELKAFLKKTLPESSWYSAIAFLAVWIDLLSCEESARIVRDRLTPFMESPKTKKWAEAVMRLKQTQAPDMVYSARQEADIRYEVPNGPKELLRAAGFKSRDEANEAIFGVRKRLDSKARNWAPTMDELAVFADGRGIFAMFRGAKGLLWQVSYRFLSNYLACQQLAYDFHDCESDPEEIKPERERNEQAWQMLNARNAEAYDDAAWNSLRALNGMDD